MIVVKKDGNREEFSPDKMLRGLIRACEKRPVSMDTLKEIVHETEKQLRSDPALEVQSGRVGELVMEQLSEVDEVAYVRFASVYRQFKDINVFIDELKDLMNRSDEGAKK
ncbi:ribonucleotide reductase transcriptional regulator NrdR [Geomicrobium sp. JCM 19037]|nr:ribonucleotide reductase transcriptional regulator NrdR [Geomicrobium sp. JCM 19037]